MKTFAEVKAFLLFGLKHYGIPLRSENGKYLSLEYGYDIEIEGPSLFKLMHENQVVAPFTSVEELCEFISQDIKLNYG
jgi:hypothetical protein